MEPLQPQYGTDLHTGRGEGREFLLHTIGDTGEHGGSARENDVAVEVPTNIEITLKDGVVPVGRASCWSATTWATGKPLNKPTQSREYQQLRARGKQVERAPRVHGTVRYQ